MAQYYLRGRLSFPALAKPQAPVINGTTVGEPKYSATVLIDKSDAEKMKYLNDYVTIANQLATATFKAQASTLLAKNPIFHDGDLKDSDGYKNCYFVRTKSARQPKFFYADRTEVPFTEIERVFYPGCEVLLIVNPYCYGLNQGPAKGVATGLMGVMFVKDAPAFGVSVDASALPTFDTAPAAPSPYGQAPAPATPQPAPATPQPAPAAPNPYGQAMAEQPPF